MSRRFAVGLLLLLAPAVRAQDVPENLLSADTQIYLRWDGVDAHRAAYEKTALGKMLKGDTGRFINGVFTQLQDSLGQLLTSQQLLGGVPPEKLQKITADAQEAPKLLNLLASRGLIVAVEVRGLEPPQAQVTLIVPDAGDQAKALFGSIRLATTLAEVEPKEVKVAGRTVHHLEAGPVHVAWWSEGKHAVVVAATEPPQVVIKRMQEQKARLPDNPLFKKLAAFKQFETSARAFVDVPAATKLARSRGKEVVKLIDDLGLDGLKSVTFYSGFDGIYERSIMELDMPGPRKGLLRLAEGKPFRIGEVPPLPPDTVGWSMTNFDYGVLYDVALQAGEAVAPLINPENPPKIRDLVKTADAILGVDIRQDLLGALGDKIVQYSSPTEGPFTLGQTFLLKVKDEGKLQESLDQVVKAAVKLTGLDVSVKKRTYHGAELREVHFRQQGIFFLPTYTIYKGWLAIGYFPQAVQGYVLRANGELPAWKVDASVQAALDKLPKEFLSVSVSDPRPTVKQLLSIAPLVGSLVNSLQPDMKFEVGMLPNAQEATHHLFPNVSVVSDDGKVLRLETRASLALPIELSGLDTYSVAIALGFILPRIF